MVGGGKEPGPERAPSRSPRARGRGGGARASFLATDRRSAAAAMNTTTN